MPSLPTRLADIRNLLQALDWDALSFQVEKEAHARLAIVGPVNSGKSTLFNLLKGHKVSAVKAVPGTTKGIVTETLGPFTLVDTPGFGEVGGIDRADIARAAAEQADVAVLVLDGAAGLHQSDYELFVLRIAAVYGESLSVRHACELLTTMAGSVALRYAATELSKIVPGPGWLIAAGITGMGTWAMGEAARVYFEGGKQLTPRQLRPLYHRQQRRRIRRRAESVLEGEFRP